jgi:hypothetical protein
MTSPASGQNPPPTRKAQRPSSAFGRWARRIFRLALLVTVLIMISFGSLMTCMPGRSFRGPLPPLEAHEREIGGDLRRHVEKLAGEIGQRNVFLPMAYAAAADYIADEFGAMGYAVEREPFAVGRTKCENLAVEAGPSQTGGEILVVGAHYDSVGGCPAANDNGSGVAALLVLARQLHGRPLERAVRFVAFANEEAPFFWTDDMGSLRYARACRQRGDKIVGMISLETIGYYSDKPGSQRYPWPFSLLYPSTGNFIGLTGNLDSRRFLRQVIGSFRRTARFPSEGAALPGFVEEGGWSDHWSFWQCGYPAIMITDTAPFRYPQYHTRDDTPDRLDYERMARVVAGLERSLAKLAGGMPR